MPQITAWQCPRSGKLFADKDEYRRYLHTLAAQRYRARTMNRYLAAWKQRLHDTLRTVNSFVDIEAWFLDPGNARFLAERIKRIEPNARALDLDHVRFTAFSLTNMHWDDCCSNSHVAPEGKRTNWSGIPDVPRGYPGWTGTVEFTIKGNAGRWSEWLQHTGIRTGSGGGGRSGMRFGCTLFAEEWPTLAVWKKLTQLD